MSLLKKTIPAWLFFLCLLAWAGLSVVFGWIVFLTTLGDPAFGVVGKASNAIAVFPYWVKVAYEDLLRPSEELYRVPRISGDPANFRPVIIKTKLRVEGLMVRTDNPGLVRAAGWRVMVGTFTIDGELAQAALVLSPKLEVVRVLPFRDEVIDENRREGMTRKRPDSVAILDDGSLLVTLEAGSTIQRFDSCGRRVWSTAGTFDHAVSIVSDKKTFWTLSNSLGRPSEVVQISVDTGKIIKRISMADIISANPSIDVLGIHQVDVGSVNENSRSPEDASWTTDPFHLNDVEPLPEELASKFPGFRAGDLLISSRSLNLIFVVDPTTYEIKWWRGGLWRRQHDPDWQPSGEISVFDNRMGRDFSRIVSTDPSSSGVRVIFDGRANDFYSRIRGKHQITEAGNILVTSPQQGRVFEVDSTGHTVWEIWNTKPGSAEFNYPVSEVFWIPVGTLDFGTGESCTSRA